ncbi:unnamed protein product [Dovyalis caffra]|uniref:Transcription elongation factor TFIIS n=1 Tax=Dovyalis caffra TaxID=77055 RepID=A0AAV1SC08_9ROSI|nr:unnamed protein product [Dovyalis caffra]
MSRIENEREKELTELFQVVEKAAAALNGGPEESHCLDALSQIKSFPVTVETLVSTKIGKNIRLLKYHPSKKIQDLASDTLALWTKTVADQKKNGSSKPPLEVEALLKCNNPLRDKVRELFYEAFCKVSNEAKEDARDQVEACDPVGVAVSLESELFEKWGNTNGSNKIKYRSVLYNINDPKNPDFRRKVLLGEVKPERVVNMSAKEMVSNDRQHKNQMIKAKAMLKCMSGTANSGTTYQFRCGRCGKRETTSCQMPTRSADEPTTTFVTCVVCNNHWKFS